MALTKLEHILTTYLKKSCKSESEFYKLQHEIISKYGDFNVEGYYTAAEALEKYGWRYTNTEDEIRGWLPSKGDYEELINYCQWNWIDDGWRITGPNGNSIFLSARGDRPVDCLFDYNVGTQGYYWTRTEELDGTHCALGFNENVKNVYSIDNRVGMSVRLVYLP